MASNFADVGVFHHKFGLPSVTTEGAGPREVDQETFEYRLAFLKEELDEFAGAYRQDDLAGVADALVDLVYVAMGTAHMFGLPWQAIWSEVQMANMAKERATNASDDRSVRKNSLDVVKPEGWTPPNIEGVLAAHGFPREVLT